VLDQDELDFLAARRARAAAPSWGRSRRATLAALVLLHLLVLALLLRAAPERPYPPRDDVLVVRLLPPEPEAAAAPTVAARRADGASPARAMAPRPAREAPAASPAPLPQTHVFNPDGSLALPRGADAPGADTAFHLPEPAAMPRPGNPLRYKPTRFDPVWVKDHETLGERWVRETTVTKTYDTKGGTRIQCVWSPLLALAAFGCGWGPTPREPAKPAPWLAVAGETRPDAPRPIDEDPFD